MTEDAQLALLIFAYAVIIMIPVLIVLHHKHEQVKAKRYHDLMIRKR